MGEFKHGLFGCFDNCGVCIMAYFCPCLVFGKTAEKVGESCCMCGAALFLPIANIIALLKIRRLVRESHGIEGSCCNDLLMWWFCGLCTLVQLAQEMDEGSPGEQAIARE